MGVSIEIKSFNTWFAKVYLPSLQRQQMSANSDEEKKYNAKKVNLIKNFDKML